jgi:hypothetical protein
VNCDVCVGVEAEHHLCDQCVQEDIASERALRAEVRKLRSVLVSIRNAYGLQMAKDALTPKPKRKR